MSVSIRQWLTLVDTSWGCFTGKSLQQHVLHFSKTMNQFFFRKQSPLFGHGRLNCDLMAKYFFTCLILYLHFFTRLALDIQSGVAWNDNATAGRNGIIKKAVKNKIKGEKEKREPTRTLLETKGKHINVENSPLTVTRSRRAVGGRNDCISFSTLLSSWGKKLFCHDILLKSLSVIMTDHLGRLGCRDCNIWYQWMKTWYKTELRSCCINKTAALKAFFKYFFIFWLYISLFGFS